MSVATAPVVALLRRDGAVLAARHPTGLRLPRGAPQGRERATDAAIRVLHEEAGLFARAVRVRGRVPGLGWPMVEMAAGPLPEAWTHHGTGGGSGTVKMLWHPLDAPPRGFGAPDRRILAALARWA